MRERYCIIGVTRVRAESESYRRRQSRAQVHTDYHNQQMEESSAWIVVTFWASLDVLYCVSAIGFLAAWQENPTVFAPLVYRCGVWSIIGLLGVLLLPQTIEPIDILLISVPCCVLTAVNVKNTRREIVEGGPPPTNLPVASTPNRVIVVTGANAGIGRETVLWFSKNEPSATILLLCRNTSKGQQVVRDANIHAATQHLHVLACDLTSFASVRQCVLDIQSKYNKIDILLQNAGVMLSNLEYTEDQHEMSLQANHLGHFLLSALLLPMIKDDGRVIVLTSSTFPLCRPDKLPYHDRSALEAVLECRAPHTYGLFSQYAKTKWCNIVHAYVLSSEFGVWSAAVHPGLVRTDVVRNMPLFMRIGYQLTGVVLATLQKTPAQGSWGTIHAVHTNDTSGCYWENRRIVLLDAELLRKAALVVWDWSCDAVKLSKSERWALERCKKKI